MKKITFKCVVLLIAMLSLSFTAIKAQDIDVGIYTGANDGVPNDSVPYVNVSTVQCWESMSVIYYGYNYGYDSVKTVFSVGIVFSTDTIYNPGSDYVYAVLPLSSIIPLRGRYAFGSGPSSPITFTAPAAEDLAPGDYYVLIVLDYDNVLSETSEANNVGHTQKITLTCTTKPDLFIDESVGYAPIFTPTTVNSPSEQIQVYYWVGNQGDAPAAVTDVKFYVSSDNVYNEGVDELIATQSTDSVFPVGYYYDFYKNITIPGNTPNGSCYVFMIVDKNNSVNEWDENNNIATPQLINVQNFTGINDGLYQSKEIRMSPNPTKDYVNVYFDKPAIEKANISVMNPMGQTVLMQSDVSLLNSNAKIDLSTLSKGSYYINIRTNDSSVTKNLIIIE